MKAISNLLFLLLFAGVYAQAESVSPYSPSSNAKSIADIRTINGDNVQDFLKKSARIVPLKMEPMPSPIAKLHNGPGIFLTLGVPAELASAMRKVEPSLPADMGNKKINFSGEDAPSMTKTNTVAAIKNPLLQDATSMGNAMPPAVWLLGFGLLGMAGISRRKKS